MTGEVVKNLLQTMEDAIETLAGDSLRSTLYEELGFRSVWCFLLHL